MHWFVQAKVWILLSRLDLRGSLVSSALTKHPAGMTVLAIYAEVVDHIKHEAGEKCVCKIEKRCSDRVKFDQEVIFREDIT